MPGTSPQQTSTLILMLRTLQKFVDSPQKKIVMAAIVGILALGVKMASKKPPIDVKNMKNEGSKVTRSKF
jgi:hypothetical protein